MNSNVEPESLDAKVAFLVEVCAGSLAHSQTNLLAHLLGTHELIRTWGARDALCDAALFHSVYGTEGYPLSALPSNARHRVRALIGVEGEELAYLFGVMVRRSFYSTLDSKDEFAARCRLSGARLVLRESQVADMCQVLVANWLEQRPRLPLQYRFMKRPEFRAMRRFLPAPAWAELDALYGVEVNVEEMQSP